MEKRDSQRSKKRVMVRYGVGGPDKTAFTRNLSEVGLQLQTNQVHRPGTELQLELKLGDRVFRMTGRVMWARRVPPQLAHVQNCGMGLQFVDPPEEWFEHFAAWAGARL